MRKVLLLWVLTLAAFGLPWTSFTTTPQWSRVSPIPFTPHRKTSDGVMNFLFYVPYGLLAAARGASFSRAVATGGAFSVGTELSQVFSTTRYPAATDVVTNVAGVMIGYAAGVAFRALVVDDRVASSNA